MERRRRPARDQGPRKFTVAGPRIFFCITHPSLGAGEGGNLGTPIDIEKKKSKLQTKACSLSQRTREGAAYLDRKMLDNTCCILAKHHRDTVAPSNPGPKDECGA